jgi:hypothetical protein
MVIEKSMAPAPEAQLHLYMFGCLPGDGMLTCRKRWLVIAISKNLGLKNLLEAVFTFQSTLRFIN